MFYNKDIFDENGWTIPTTFSEFEELLAKVAQTDYVPIALGATDPWDILFIWEPILAATHLDWIQEYETEGYAAVNDPRVADAYNKMIEWGDKGYFGDNWTGVTGQGASLAFSTGSAVMYIGGTWNISTFQENNPALNFGAFQIPCEDGQVPFVSTSSWWPRRLQQDGKRSGSARVRKLLCKPGRPGKVARHAGLHLLRRVHRFR